MVNFYCSVKTTLPLKRLSDEIVKKAAKVLNIKKEFIVSVLAVGDEKIRSLNKKYRRQDKVTDVLSFSSQEGEKIISWPEEKSYLGEIFISLPQIKRQAKKFKRSFKQEFSLMLAHGFLHLLGYDHQTQAQERKMARLEQRIIG